LLSFLILGQCMGSLFPLVLPL